MRKATVSWLAAIVIVFCAQLGFGAVCKTSARLGQCGPYHDAAVTGSDGTNVNVLNNVWSRNVPAGSSQTMYSRNPGKWYVEAQYPTGNQAVESYPDSDAIYLSAPPLVSSFTYIYSSFAQKMNLNPNTSAQAAYDIWLNGHENEVMIWTDISHRSTAGCKALADAIPFGGAHGVREHLWDLWICGKSEIIWELKQSALRPSGIMSNGKNGKDCRAEKVEVGTPEVYGISRGSVDILAMLQWLQRKQYLPSDSTLTQLEYGFEIASTGGLKERFQLTGWSLTEQPGLPPKAPPTQ